MSPIIEIKNLHKSFKKFKALDGINLTVNEGEILGFLGCNGAGKSTTIRCLLTLIKPDSGDIFYRGENIKQCRNIFLQRIGAMVEKPDFYKHLSLYTNLKLGAWLYGIRPTKKEIFDLLKLVGLEGKERIKFKACSQGMKQRLGIASTLIHNPEIIILDEPTNGLDPRGMIEFRQLLLKLKNELKKTIIISSHILSELELIVDSLVIIDRGKNIAQGSAKELLNPDEVIVTLECTDHLKLIEVIKSSRYANQIETIGDSFINLKSNLNELPQMHKDIVSMNIPIINFMKKRKLEDLFLSLTDK